MIKYAVAEQVDANSKVDGESWKYRFESYQVISTWEWPA